LYEVTTGLRLFKGESAAATASRVMDAPVRHPKAVLPDLDPRLDHIIMKLLERNQQTRYQTAAALAADLEALRASPGFLAGGFGLRTAVRTLFPDEGSTPVPALGSSLSGAVRSSPAGAFQAIGPARGTDDWEGDAAASPAASSDGGVSLRMVLAIAAACALGSLIFWLFVF
jgi:hypothetical protein